MSVSRCGALLLTVALAAPVVRAQQQQPPSFRSSTALVAVDAAVVDKDGKPVTDLTAADFEIVEDGVSHAPQTIYLVSSDPAFVRAGNASTDANAPTSTTVPTRRELRSRVIVFFLDLDHLSADGYKRSRTAIEGFLKDSAASADLVGVLAGGQMLNNKIDTDKPALLKAMASMKGPNFARYDDMRMWPRILDDAEANDIARTMEETINRVVQRACIDDPDQCRDREMVRAMVESKARNITSIAARQADLSLLMLETVTKGLSRLPGTKQVIAFSDGFFTGERVGRLKALVETAAQNNVRFSTMDARGLGRDIRSREFMAAGPVVAAGDNSAVTMDANSDVLATLALDTGGEMFINRNDLRPAVDRVVQAAGTYYVLGYAPTRAMDGKYHAVTVKVRRAGVTILARRGYVASPIEAPTPAPLPAPSAMAANAPATPATIPGSPSVVAPPAAADFSAPITPPAAPRFRPNSDANVATLTRVAPAGGDASAAKALADAGWDAYALGDLAVAREKLSSAVATGQAAPWVSYALGFTQYALGQYDSALAAWDRVRASVPQFMPVYFDVADAYLSLGRGTDALAVLRDASRRWPDEPESQNALATLLVKRGAYDDAIDVLAKITTAKPADALGFFNLGRAHQLRYLKLQQSAASARIPSSALGEDDRQRAIAAFKRYVAIGGPFEKDAKDAIATLDWK